MSSRARIARTKTSTPLARRRVAAGLSQSQLATAAGIPLTTYRRLERGAVRKPSATHLAAVGEVLGCEVKDLLTGAGENPGAAADPAYGQNMGRAQNSSAAIGASRRVGIQIPMAARHLKFVQQAREGDYRQFLAVAQGSGADTEMLLRDEDGFTTICHMAVHQEHVAHRAELLARVNAAAPMPERVAESIISAMVPYAIEDVEVALRTHVRTMASARPNDWRPATQDELVGRAYAALAARVSWAVGQPHNHAAFGAPLTHPLGQHV